MMKSLLQHIGDFQILEKLGRGGMSDVYLAFDEKSHRRVALKLVERGPGEDAREIVAAERLGAELQANLSAIEPRVPRIYDFGDLDDFFFINMEFVEGRDLSEIIRTGALDPTTAANVARELCSILRNAHAITLRVGGREFRAIVHGDIKPGNIRIESEGQVRVLDFGIAKGLSLTRRLTANLFGSVAYSSPERLESGRIDEMSDLWSVGAVLYEMIEGRLPYDAASTERLETIVRSRAAPRPLGNECPADLQHIVYKALARLPGRRYQTAEQLESDLRAFLAGEPTLAREESEETRRTTPAEDERETRRTSPPGGGTEEKAQTPEKSGPPAIVPLAGKVHPWIRRALKWACIGGALLLAGVGIWQGAVYRSALQLRPDFVGARVDPDTGWTKYQEVRGRSLLGMAAYPLRVPLQNILRESSQKIVDDYRNSDQPKTREVDWIRCKRYMSRAVELDPSDSRAAAMLAYADGQILRINRKDLSAVAAFQRASKYEPKWPDPYLGMARTFIYNLQDGERGTQALQRAKDLGLNFGKRELAMMGDAFRMSGLRAWDGATRLRGTDQEKELLKKAEGDLKQAIQTYSQIAPWGGSTNQILATQDVLTKVEDRLKELNPPNPLFPWNWFRKLISELGSRQIPAVNGDRHVGAYGPTASQTGNRIPD